MSFGPASPDAGVELLRQLFFSDRKASKELRSVILMEFDIYFMVNCIFFCKENKLKELEMKRIV